MLSAPLGCITAGLTWSALSCPARPSHTVAGPRALSFVGQMAMGIPEVQIHQLTSKPLPRQHPSPPPRIVPDIFRPQAAITPASRPSLFYSSSPSTPMFRLISSVHGWTLAFHRSSAVDWRDSNCHLGCITASLTWSALSCQARPSRTVAGPRALSFVGQMAIGIPEVQIHRVMSKPLPLQHPSPPRPCIVLAFPTFSFLRIERPSSVHRRALAPHRTPPCSTPHPRPRPSSVSSLPSTDRR